MENRLHIVAEELRELKIQSSLDSKRIGELTKDKVALTTGMRDRDEELRGKAKLLEVGFGNVLCVSGVLTCFRMYMMKLCH